MRLFKKFSIIAGLILACTLTYAQDYIPRDFTQKHVQIIKHTGYTTAYNSVTRIPVWVAWTITSDRLSKSVTSRSGYDFVPDPQTREFCPDSRQYSRSGYDRGHMCPAADCKWSEKAMEESFYLSNVCPQDRILNAGYWLVLEKYTRKIAYKYGKADVICGPIISEINNKTIGSCKISVPNAFFRVVQYFDKKGERHTESWIVPNISVDDSVDIDTYKSDFETVATLTGLSL